jgi:hypothetical protein
VKPIARRDGVLVRELPDELIVYDLRRHEAHCLNRTAALVFRRADGTRTPSEIAAALGGDTEPAEREAVVSLALQRLAELGLVDGSAAPVASASATPARRDVLRRLGLGAALLVPTIVSVLAPTPAAAASCTNNCVGQPDTTPCNCASGPPCIGSCIGGTCTSGGPC